MSSFNTLLIAARLVLAASAWPSPPWRMQQILLYAYLYGVPADDLRELVEKLEANPDER